MLSPGILSTQNLVPDTLSIDRRIRKFFSMFQLPQSIFVILQAYWESARLPDNLIFHFTSRHIILTKFSTCLDKFFVPPHRNSQAWVHIPNTTKFFLNSILQAVNYWDNRRAPWYFNFQLYPRTSNLTKIQKFRIIEFWI